MVTSSRKIAMGVAFYGVFLGLLCAAVLALPWFSKYLGLCDGRSFAMPIAAFFASLLFTVEASLVVAVGWHYTTVPERLARYAHEFVQPH